MSEDMFKRYGKSPFDEKSMTLGFESERNEIKAAFPEQEKEVPPRIFGSSGLDEPQMWKEDASPELNEEEQPETTLGEGVVFKGELSFQNFLRIDGHFEGDLLSDGKLVIGSSGFVKASELQLKEAIIEGRLEGNIFVKERLELRGQAQVHGDVRAKFLSVDEGVTLVGRVEVQPEETSKNSEEPS